MAVSSFPNCFNLTIHLTDDFFLLCLVFYGGAGLAGNVTLLSLLIYGGTLVARSEISVGDLTSLMVYSFYM